MTESSLRGRAPRSRTRWILLIAALTTVVAVGVIAAVLTIPADHKTVAPRLSHPRNPAKTSQPPASSPPSASALTGAPSVVAPVSTSPSSDPNAALEQQVITGFLTFQRTLNQQLSEIGANTSPLLAVASGQALTNAEDAVAKLRGKGEIQRGSPTITHIGIVSMPSIDTAVVCAVEDDSPTQIVFAKTGNLVASGFPPYISRTTMALENGAWKATLAASVDSCG